MNESSIQAMIQALEDIDFTVPPAERDVPGSVVDFAGYKGGLTESTRNALVKALREHLEDLKSLTEQLRRNLLDQLREAQQVRQQEHAQQAHQKPNFPSDTSSSTSRKRGMK